MNQIKVEKRKGVWLWVLAGLAIVAMLIYLFSNKDMKDAVGHEQVTDITPVKEDDSTITDFISFIKEDSTTKMNQEHDYTSNALIKLANSVEVLAHKVGDLNEDDLDKAKEYALKITENPSSTEHAEYIRKAADILTDALQSIQQAEYPGLSNDVAELRNASASINPDVLTLHQKEAVKSFFNAVADLLRKMNDAG